jgi:multiple sugar transport system substrate-binding protein
VRITRRHALGGMTALAAGDLLGRSSPATAVTPGRPHAGSELKVMVVRASQFAAEAKRLPAFEEATGIKVTFVDIPFVAMREKLTAEMIAGSTDFDLVTPIDVWIPPLVDSYLAPLKQGLGKHGIDLGRYPAPFLRSGLFNDDCYGLPIRCHIQLLFYRKDLLGELGLEPPKTWEELVTAGKALQEKKGIAGVAVPYGKNNGQNLMVWYNFLWGAGGDLFDAAGKPAFNSEAGLRATRDYVGLMLDHKITPTGAGSFFEQDAVNSFVQGNSAMLPVWWHVYNRFKASDSAIKLDQVGFSLLPSYPGRPATTYTNNWIYGINKNSAKQDAAMEFLAWVSGADIERSILLDPAENDVVAVHKGNLADPQVNERFGGMHRLAAQALENSNNAIPNTPEFIQVVDVLEVAMSTIATGGATVPDAMNGAAAQAARIMRRAR